MFARTNMRGVVLNKLCQWAIRLSASAAILLFLGAYANVVQRSYDSHKAHDWVNAILLLTVILIGGLMYDLIKFFLLVRFHVVYKSIKSFLGGGWVSVIYGSLFVVSILLAILLDVGSGLIAQYIGVNLNYLNIAIMLFDVIIGFLFVHELVRPKTWESAIDR